jgi:hypothetical protein
VGLRAHTAPYSFVTPQKSKQKKAPDLLALRVPSTTGLQGALAKLGLKPSNIPRLIALPPFRSDCVAREVKIKKVRLAGRDPPVLKVQFIYLLSSSTAS